MSSEQFALTVAVVLFASGLLGLGLQRLLHEKHTTGPARDMIGAITGLLTLLCALVTGLLIWTAYGVYAGQNTAIQTLASKILQLDLALVDYGPEAIPNRTKLRESVKSAINQVWGASENDRNFRANNFGGAIQAMSAEEKALKRLRPSTDEQKEALSAAVSAVAAIGQARLQISLALSAPVSYPLLLIVVAWVSFLFCGFGLMSRGGPMPVVALAVGSAAVASAVLLILALSNPYSGIFRASPAPLEQVLAVMGKE